MRLSAVIRDLYSEKRRSSSATGSGEWLADNYYLIYRRSHHLLDSFAQMPNLPFENGEIRILEICRSFITQDAESKIEIFDKMIEEASSQMPLQNVELDMLPAFLEYSCFEMIRKSAEAKDAKGIARAIKLLRFCSGYDFTPMLEKHNGVNQLLQEDPAGIYPKMDETSRFAYRKAITDQAQKSKISEIEYAQKLLDHAKNAKDDVERHIGTILLAKPVTRKIRALILSRFQTICTFFICAAYLLRTKDFICSAALYFPVRSVLKPLFEKAALWGIEPTVLPRIEFGDRIPPENSVLVVVSSLLPSAGNIDSAIQRLKDIYHISQKGEVRFCLLCDPKESDFPSTPQEEYSAKLLKEKIDLLNRTLADKFYLAVRPRSFIKTQGKFAGKERKRGAIGTLVNIITGQSTDGLLAFCGNITNLRNVKYLLVLDSDTALQLDSVYKFVGAAAHPLNRKYGIFSPSLGIKLASMGNTPFTKLMCETGGTVAYDNNCSEYYQDIFNDSVFSGKGLIDVSAFANSCVDRLPEERILSHDILEGCLLRTCYLSDTQLSDDFPSTPEAWLDRLHRWIRGDIQNLIFAIPELRAKYAPLTPAFSALSSKKLLENTARAFLPILSAICLVCAAAEKKRLLRIIQFCLGVGYAVFPQLNALIQKIRQGGLSVLQRRFFGNSMPVFLRFLAASGVGILMLPQTAYTGFDAIIRALWRSFVSGKNLLEWTTAAENEKNSVVSIRRYIPALLFWLFLFLAGGGAAFKAFSLTALCATPTLKLLGRPQKKPFRQEADTERANVYASLCWKFFTTYVSAEDNYLPPDNVQETPVFSIAHRTSPTNIGLYLCSIVSACDFGIITFDTMLELLDRTLKTVEKLNKFKGHLYNWYDTKTLRPLTPRYISTVDSGNFVCCLTALKGALIERNSEDQRVYDLLARLERLRSETDFTFLYNRRRSLFHVGYRCDTESPDTSYYDMLMSEARMTGYYAIAKGIAERKHWGNLCRILVGKHGYTGVLSWSGTMFEYLMPHLFLPMYEGSLEGESVRFCLYCQKMRRGKMDGNSVWGISESGFYVFDPQMNYQYKANGVQKLALCRGMDEELVISPYSSFLALPYDTKEAMENLKTLEELGMLGNCGFFEAMDFTPARVGSQPAIIRSYMSHHVGMSILSLGNLIHNNIWQNRFFSDPDIKAAAELLRERIEIGAPVYKNTINAEERRPKPGRPIFTREQLTEISPLSPRCSILCNSSFVTVLTDSGTGFCSLGETDILRRSDDLLKKPTGVFVCYEFDGVRRYITSAPDYTHPAGKSTIFNGDNVIYQNDQPSVSAKMTVTVHRNVPAEYRKLEFENHTGEPAEIKVLVYAEPALAHNREIAAHPAFVKLFTRNQYDDKNGSLIFWNRNAALAVGMITETEFEFGTDRQLLLSTPDGIHHIPEVFDQSLDNGGWRPDSGVFLRFTLSVEPYSTVQQTVIFAAGMNKAGAADNLRQARKSPKLHSYQPIGATGLICRNAFGSMLFGASHSVESIIAARENQLSPRNLWSVGISGDCSILLLEIHSDEDASRASSYVMMHQFLRQRGLGFDLVIVFDDSGEYESKLRKSLNEIIKSNHAEPFLNQKFGIFLLNEASLPHETIILLRAAAGYIAPHFALGRKETVRKLIPTKVFPSLPVEITKDSTCFDVSYGFFKDTRFICENGNPLPRCLVLANPSFGTLVSENALGFTWALNSHLMKLTPFENDTVSDNQGERLYLRIHGKIYDLINGSTAIFSGNGIEYHSKIEDITAVTTVTVPENGMAKRINIKFNAASTYEAETAFYCEPVLGENSKFSFLLKARWIENRLIIGNFNDQNFSGFMCLDEQTGCDGFTCDRASFFAGRWNDKVLAPCGNNCACIRKSFSLYSGKEFELNFALGYGETAESAALACKISNELPKENISSSVKFDDLPYAILFNEFLPNQILQCRMYGRTGFYQNGGAWGFRDQLQDSLAALYFSPEAAKAQILRAAACQFQPGDVLHWWHNLDGEKHGIRSRYRDDPLWLILAACRYAEFTDDLAIFDYPICYLDGLPLESYENERYAKYEKSCAGDTLFEHCCTAFRQSLTFGEHDLPLFGGGDWNDGFNRIGNDGKSESVWLGMFLKLVADEFTALCIKLGHADTAQKAAEIASRMKKSIENTCWNDDRFIRGFLENKAFGYEKSDSVKIDLLPQAFAVLAGIGTAKQQNTALDTALQLLYDPACGILKLFAPPLGEKDHSIGYTADYPEGVRENGGQYTHGACFFAYALFSAGRADDGWRILRGLVPALDQFVCNSNFYLEPYAIPADISTNPNAYGRGGWSLYTGAAGWYYRTILEKMLGVKISGKNITFSPCIPTTINDCKLTLTNNGRKMFITYLRKGESKVLQDGSETTAVQFRDIDTQIEVWY